MSAAWEAMADRYARLRWVGMGLFLVGAGTLALTVASVADGQPARTLLIALFGTGLALGSFGAANDTALHAMVQLHRAGALPPRHAAEFRHENEVRGARLRTLHASPKAAGVLPFVSVLALTWVLYRLLPAFS